MTRQFKKLMLKKLFHILLTVPTFTFDENTLRRDPVARQIRRNFGKRKHGFCMGCWAATGGAGGETIKERWYLIDEQWGTIQEIWKCIVCGKISYTP